MKKIIITTLFSILFCSTTYANSPFPFTKVSGLIVHDSGAFIMVQLKNPVATGEGCPSSQDLKLKVSHPLFKIMYATLLAAFQSQTPIQGWINGCDFREPILTRVDVYKQ